MKLAFVPARFGPGVLGGAEDVTAEAASGFAERGFDVEVITTCAVDHYTWANELPEGMHVEKGLPVRRFPTVRMSSRAAAAAWSSIQSGKIPDLERQVSWISSQFSAPGLFEYLLRHGQGYDAIVFSPYMLWTTSVCVPFVADRAVVIPCLHDEIYARFEVLSPVLAEPALIWFLSEPEHLLAHRLGPVSPNHEVTGCGVPVPEGYDPSGFRSRHRLERPFALYAGRREEGKGLNALLDHFFAATLARGLDLDLVLIGKGALSVPERISRGVVDLGYISGEERDNAFAAASVYVQPSPNESFSRTVMEAWLAGTPVVAYAGSTVVSWHCERSGGGLTYSDAAGFYACIRSVLTDPAEAARRAGAGRQYVLDNYTWPVVLDRMETSLRSAL